MSANGQSGLPAYQKIQGSIRERIDAGDLKPGDAVASERELARLHRVSLMTATRSSWVGAGGDSRAAPWRRHFCCPASHTFQQIDELYRADGQPGAGGRV